MTNGTHELTAKMSADPTFIEGHKNNFAVVRLGAESEEVINKILTVEPTTQRPFTFQIKCKQVPKGIESDIFAFIWLGTNNSKGGATPWTQGLRALGQIKNVEGEPKYNDEKTVTLEVKIILGESLTKKDFIKAAGDEYIHISDLPVVGINNYSSQVVQRIEPSEESQHIDILMQSIEKLAPGFSHLIKDTYPELSDLFHRIDTNDISNEQHSEAIVAKAKLFASDIPHNDPTFLELLARVRRLLKDGFGGVIFRGPPGTGKSWYARRIGAQLADCDSARIRFVQFHPSYQYEDFVEGFVPDPNGTFESKQKHLLEICDAARMDQLNRIHVLVIDELSRTDPIRVFGEALTYIEASKRNEEFYLASGRKFAIPSNLVILATMNVWDRGIDEVDTAVERRFASITLDPNRDVLFRMLEGNGVEPILLDRILTFFDSLQRDPNPMIRIGHTYFSAVQDESGMHRLWNHQLRFVMERAFPLEKDGFARIVNMWLRLFPEDSSATADNVS